MIRPMVRRMFDSLIVQHVMVGLIIATVLCAWFEFPLSTFWAIVIGWPLITVLFLYAFVHGTIPGMNL